MNGVLASKSRACAFNFFVMSFANEIIVCSFLKFILRRVGRLCRYTDKLQKVGVCDRNKVGEAVATPANVCFVRSVDLGALFSERPLS